MKLEFETVGEYLDSFKAKPFELGILPVPLAADHLGKTPAAVTAMVKAQTLRQIVIGKNKFVQTASILDREAGAVDQEKIVRNYLIDMLKRGETSTFYEPLMDAIGLKTTIPWHRTRIGAILDVISKQSHQERGVVLSVLVHRKAPGTTRPGPGFWGMAEDEGLFDPDAEDRDEFVKRHTKEVIKAYS